MPLRFECPHCSARLSSGRDLYHSVAECPECGQDFMVPAPEDIKLPTENLKFICPRCRRKLSARPEQFDTEMPCPYTDCDEILKVPAGSWQRIDLPSEESGPSES